jgi:hypothetical protein
MRYFVRLFRCLPLFYLCEIFPVHFVRPHMYARFLICVVRRLIFLSFISVRLCLHCIVFKRPTFCGGQSIIWVRTLRFYCISCFCDFFFLFFGPCDIFMSVYLNYLVIWFVSCPNCHLSGRFRIALRGSYFSSDQELKEAVHVWLVTQSKNFFLRACRSLRLFD